MKIGRNNIKISEVIAISEIQQKKQAVQTKLGNKEIEFHFFNVYAKGGSFTAAFMPTELEKSDYQSLDELKLVHENLMQKVFPDETI